MNTLFSGCIPALLLLALGVNVSNGQAPALEQIDQSTRTREANQAALDALPPDDQAPELFEGESDDLGPQSILRLSPKRHFQVTFDSQLYHTDNFFLTDDGETDATALVSTLEAALAPSAYELGPGELSPRIGVRLQWYNFGLIGRESGAGLDYNTFDFDAQTVFMDGRYHFGTGWNADLGLEVTRLIDHDGHREQYKEIAPSWGLQKRIELCPVAHLLLGYEGVFHSSEADDSIPANFRLTDRIDRSLYAAVTTVWGRHFVAQPFYRFRYTDFLDSSRSDCLHSAGLGLHYFFTSQLSVRAQVSYDHRNTSDSPVPDYGKLDIGAGVNLTLSF